MRPAAAQVPHAAGLPANAHLVLPQASRVWHPDRRVASEVRVTAVEVGVVIDNGVAATTMEVALSNPGAGPAESVLLLPVPDGATVAAFDFQGVGTEAAAKLLPKDEAKATYDGIVAKLRDPALLEFAGYNLVRSSVFPVPARGTQKVRLTYEHVLPADGDRVDYVLPRSENLTAATVPWSVSVRIKGRRPLSGIYSPSHEVAVQRDPSGTAASVRVAEASRTEPGPFRLSYLMQGGAVSATMFAYPDPKTGGGYFLLLAGVPAKVRTAEATAAPVKREVTLVIDTSGSMAGEKMEQVRAAALQVVEGLAKGEAFNIIDYNTGVSSFAEKPVIKDDDTPEAARRYIRRLEAEGGTNIHDALVEALRPAPRPGMLPLVLFLTDGQPTIRVTSESALREVAAKANVHNRRLFTFGVGYDINGPLLTALARESRATGTFVLPRENVEEKVSQVFRRLSGLVLASPTLKVVGAGGTVDTRAVRDLQPARQPDLFEGDQLVVLGRYTAEGKLKFRLEGEYLGSARAFEFEMDTASATVRNAFVPRLWASRKIATLVEEIRAAGAAAKPAAGGVPADPRFKELTDEIVRLSTEFGVLTEYTSFLALEGTDLSMKDKVLAEAAGRLHGRAYASRAGVGAVNQELNNNTQAAQSCLNRRNGHWDAGMNRVEVTTVQQVCDRTLYRRGGMWVDAANLDRGLHADAIIVFGTPEFDALMTRLVREGRQGLVSLSESTLLDLDGKKVLVKMNDC
jgi:Ca-activated chloride channel family protein